MRLRAPMSVGVGDSMQWVYFWGLTSTLLILLAALVLRPQTSR